MANTHELATTDYMNAQRIVQNCVLKNQSTVIEEMIRANLISEDTTVQRNFLRHDLN